MNKKTRFMAVMMAAVMGCRYSEAGALLTMAQEAGTETGQTVNGQYVTMVAKDIQTYCHTAYQGGIHEDIMPDGLEEAIKGMFYDRAEFLDYYQSFEKNSVLQNSLYSACNVIVNSSQIQVLEMIGARIGQQMNADSFELGRNGVLYAAQGDITVNASDVEIGGLIYAPHGCVTINASQAVLGGLIIAERIVVHADTFSEEPEENLRALYEGLRMDFCPEILVTGETGGKINIYGGNINIKKMGIYLRLNGAEQFEKVAEADGNEYGLVLGEEAENVDIRVLCTNILGQEEFSDIVSIQKQVQEDGTELFVTVIQDSDEDGLPDGYEIWDTGTNPYEADSDGDGLPDGYEILYAHTNPLEADSDDDRDEDGLTALEEYRQGTNPLYPDTDFDGIADSQDKEPLMTEALADQSEYQGNIGAPGEGFYDRRKIYVDADGKRQTQMFNCLTKEEYFDIQDGNVFLKVKTGENAETVLNVTGDKTEIETTVTEEDGRKSLWAVNGNVYRYEEVEENTIATYLNDTYVSTAVYDGEERIVNMEYANGTVLEYRYDADGNLEGLSADGKELYRYEYGENSVTVTDMRTGETEVSIADAENGKTEFYGKNGLMVDTQTNTGEKMSGKTEKLNMTGIERITGYQAATGETQTNVTMVYPGEQTMLETAEQQGEGQVIRRYVSNDVMLAEKVMDEDGKVVQEVMPTGSYQYTYDKAGNVTEVEKDGELLYRYHYDEKGQLEKYIDYAEQKVYEYRYDENYNLTAAITMDMEGNLLNQDDYEYDEDATTGLKSFSGKEIGYDVSGNPLIYYDGKIMDWMNGRILQAIHTDVGNVSYEYNSNGVRTAKTVNNIRTEYLRDAEGRLLGEETQGEYLWYLYDATGKAAGYEWQGNSYYYVRNAMGDVEGISDMEGNLLCSYYYDAWGNVTEVTGDRELAEKNSIRYRGYYYDEESGFYYLKTRYYDPEVKRFLNRDCLENESNLYQYCYNNPVNYSDESGMSAYSCSDRYVEIVELSGYTMSTMTIIPGDSKYMVSYFNGSKYAYLNCFLWSIGIKVIDPIKYDYGQVVSNEIGVMGTPGYWCNDIRKLRAEDSLNQLEGYTKRDLQSLGYKIISVTSVTPSYSSTRHALAFRLRTNKGWDYHFMRLRKGENSWSFKAGWIGPIMQLRGNLKPNQVSWSGYDCENQFVWNSNGVYYNSAIMYIIYK